MSLPYFCFCFLSTKSLISYEDCDTTIVDVGKSDVHIVFEPNELKGVSNVAVEGAMFHALGVSPGSRSLSLLKNL